MSVHSISLDTKST